MTRKIPVALAAAAALDPAADRIRVVNENDENLRLNPNNGAVKLRVEVTATDAAGNRSVARDTIRLKPR